MLTDADIVRLINQVEYFGSDEQLINTYKDIDFTGHSHIYDYNGNPSETNQFFLDSKKEISDLWRTVLKETTDIKSSKNYSETHPIKVLENCSDNYYAGLATAVAAIPHGAETSKQMIDDVVMPVVGIVILDYLQEIGKSPYDLTEEEVRFQIERVNSIFMKMLMRNLQIAQRVPEIADIVKKNGAHTDFNPDVMENHDKIDFLRHWNHLRTAVGKLLSFERLTEDFGEDNPVLAASLENGETVIKEQMDDLLERFISALPDSTDQEIVRMRYYNKMTQTEIATALGYQSQSMVAKRMAKIQKKFMAYTDLK